MNKIVEPIYLENPMLPGMRIYKLEDGFLRKGKSQNILINILPFGIIPLHKHESNAVMFIVAGYAELLSKDNMNGTQVAVGDRIHWDANSAHGFKAGEAGLSFISTNEGIVDESFQEWDMEFI